MNGPSSQNLKAFFPKPSLPPTSLCPQRFPGIDDDTTETLVKLLRENHVKYHVLYGERKFHNHIAHRLLALWALGAQGSIIQAYYETDGELMHKSLKSPAEITESNFFEHLGDVDYCSSYSDFFAKEIQVHGTVETLEKFVFSDEYNVDKGFMLGQYWAGVLHPMIHVGYGMEFGIPGLVAEGLAMGATSDLINSDILGKSFFKNVPAPDNVALAASSLSSLSLRSDPSSAQAIHGNTDTTVFDVLASILADDRLATHKSKDLFTELEFTMNERGSLVRERADKWTIDVSKPGEIERKIEELFWLNTLIYAVAGWSEDKEFRGDFFYMHLVTSALFLPSHVAYLSPRSQILLLRSYLTMSLLTYIFRGRPPVDSPAITAFWNGTTTAHSLVTPTGPLSVPHTPVRAVPADAAQNPNPWLPLVQSAILNENDHHAKIVRALLHCAQVYGSRPKGHWAGKGGSDAIGGLEVLDGTLFLRAAELTAWFERDENQEWGPGHQRWAFEGFYG